MSDTHEHPPTITIRREGGFRFRVRFDHERMRDIVTDEPPPLGTGSAPNPPALLGAAVGSCLASSLLFCLQKAHLEVHDLEADVEVRTARNEQGRLRISDIQVVLAPGVNPGVSLKSNRCLELFESFCVVTESVRNGIDVRVTVEPRTGGESLPVGPVRMELAASGA